VLSPKITQNHKAKGPKANSPKTNTTSKQGHSLTQAVHQLGHMATIK
jgi:hypothetical protein